MKTRVIGNPSALQKLAHVDRRSLGQQGTTRALYHYLPYTAEKTFEFFINLNSSAQLFKNIETNKLTEGEALVIKRIFFPVLIMNPLVPTQILSMNNIENLGILGILGAKIDVSVGNQIVVKDYPIMKAMASNNDKSKIAGQCYIDLESEIVLERDIEFKVTIKQAGSRPEGFPENYMIGIALDGYGKILNQKKNV